jgi:hypothetical protein
MTTMASTKGTGTAVLSAVTTTQTSSAIDTSADNADELYVSLVVVGTPTVSASFIIQQSPDGGSTYYSGPSYTAALAAGTYNWGPLLLGMTCTKVKVAFTQQNGGTSGTLTAQLNKVTGL